MGAVSELDGPLPKGPEDYYKARDAPDLSCYNTFSSYPHYFRASLHDDILNMVPTPILEPDLINGRSFLDIPPKRNNTKDSTASYAYRSREMPIRMFC